MMANHSAQYPDGYLDKETFKSFFAISGNSGSFKYQPGYERIPGEHFPCRAFLQTFINRALATLRPATVGARLLVLMLTSLN